MPKYDKKTALQIIVNAAKEYELKLNNKHFLIVYHDFLKMTLKLMIKGKYSRN